MNLAQLVRQSISRATAAYKWTQGFSCIPGKPARKIWCNIHDSGFDYTSNGSSEEGDETTHTGARTSTSFRSWGTTAEQHQMP